MENLPEDILFMIAEFGASYKVPDKRWFDEIRLIDPVYSLEALLIDLIQYKKLSMSIDRMQFKNLFFDLVNIKWNLSMGDGDLIFTCNREDSDRISEILEGEGYHLSIRDPEEDIVNIHVSMNPSLRMGLISEFTMMNQFIRNDPLSVVLIEKIPYDSVRYKSVLRSTKSHIPITSVFKQQLVDEIKKIRPEFSLEQEYRKRYGRSKLISSLKKRQYFGAIDFIKRDSEEVVIEYYDGNVSIKWPVTEQKLPIPPSTGIEEFIDTRYLDVQEASIAQFKEIVMYLWDGLPGTTILDTSIRGGVKIFTN